MLPYFKDNFQMNGLAVIMPKTTNIRKGHKAPKLSFSMKTDLITNKTHLHVQCSKTNAFVLCKLSCGNDSKILRHLGPDTRSVHVQAFCVGFWTGLLLSCAGDDVSGMQ